MAAKWYKIQPHIIENDILPLDKFWEIIKLDKNKYTSILTEKQL